MGTKSAVRNVAAVVVVLLVFCLAKVVSSDCVNVTCSIPNNGCGLSQAGYADGGRFTAIAFDSVGGTQIVYVGSDVAGVFKSTGGSNFEPQGCGLGGLSVAGLFVDPNTHDVVALTNAGLYYSMDQAQSWQLISSAISYNANNTSRYFGSHLIVSTGNSLWVGTDAQGVFQIPWPLPSTPSSVGPANVKVNSLAVSSSNNVYAVTSDPGDYSASPSTCSTCGLVWIYTQGTGWTSLPKIPPGSQNPNPEMMDIALDQAGNVYAVDRWTGLWSYSRGIWSPWQTPSDDGYTPQFKGLSIASDNNTVFMTTYPYTGNYYYPPMLCKGTISSGMISAISPITFTLTCNSPVFNTNKSLADPEQVVFSPSGQQMFMTDGWNVWNSTNEGTSWSQCYCGLQNTSVAGITVDPNTSNIYLSTYDDGLIYLPSGAGPQWQVLTVKAQNQQNTIMGGNAKALEISTHTNSQNYHTMYLLADPTWSPASASGSGYVYVYMSVNGGTIWNEVGFPIPDYVPGTTYTPTNLKIDPTDSSDNTVYVGTDGYGVFKTVNGLTVTGPTWTQINNGLPIDPSTNGVRVVGPNALLVLSDGSVSVSTIGVSGGIFKLNRWRKQLDTKIF